MNKQKKKLPLAMQIFIALILAIVVGLLIQSHATFAENYIIFHYVWNHIYEGYQKSRSNRSENGCILYVYDSICHYDRSAWR